MSEVEKILRKFSHDPKVLEITRRIGPVFPRPGPHYDYADFIEHVRASTIYMSSCDLDELLTYHLPEIYKRKNRLLDAIAEARDTGVITGREYEHAYNHIDEVSREWVKQVKEYFNKCVCKK